MPPVKFGPREPIERDAHRFGKFHQFSISSPNAVLSAFGARAYIVLDRPNVDIRTTEYSVFVQLSQLNSSKAPGPDGLPSWFLKENADVLAKPVSDILLHIGRVVFLCLGKWQTCHHSPSKNLYRM